MNKHSEVKLVKCRFLDENGEPKGREYTYAAKEDMDVGQIVTTESGKSLVVTETDLPPDAAAAFGDKLKFVTAKAEKEIKDTFDDVVVLDQIDPPNDIYNADYVDEVQDITPVDTTARQDELIIVEQLPVITERLAAVSAEIDRRIAAVLGMDCTEDTVKFIKNERSMLNKEFGAFEDKRKQVKSAVMSPYEMFEAVYKEHVSDKYKAADSKLKTEIDNVENEVKSRKRKEAEDYFNEHCLADNIDFIPFEALNLSITLSASVKSLKDQVVAFIGKVKCDLAMIDTQEHKEEILVEYRRTLNASLATTTVIDRHKAIEAQKKRQAEAEARKKAEMEAVKKVDAAMPQPVQQPLAPPLRPKGAGSAPPQSAAPAPAESDPVKTVSFKVTAPISKLKELKKFLVEGGYYFE